MIVIVLFLILLLSSKAHAEDHYREVLAGGLTYHVFDPDNVSEVNSNKISKDGRLIANPLLGYRSVDTDGLDYTSMLSFVGVNSINQPIFGAAASIGIAGDFGRIGFIGGAYMQDNRKFLDKGVQPFTLIPGSGWGPTPLLGVEYIHKIDLSNKTYLMLNTLISPIILNASIGIGWRI